MTAFSITREVRAPASELWDLLVDWPRHGGWVPLTTMRVDGERGHGVGSTFVGRTALGPVGFDDVMRVVKANGGLEKIHLAFYQDRGMNDKEPWHFWRLEGPGFVWNYRILPHVHTYVNISSKLG